MHTEDRTASLTWKSWDWSKPSAGRCQSWTWRRCWALQTGAWRPVIGRPLAARLRQTRAERRSVRRAKQDRILEDKRQGPLRGKANPNRYCKQWAWGMRLERAGRCSLCRECDRRLVLPTHKGQSLLFRTFMEGDDNGTRMAVNRQRSWRDPGEQGWRRQVANRNGIASKHAGLSKNTHCKP